MSEHDNGFSAGPVLLSFFVGGLIGAGVALLTAPKTGKETRRMIRELAEEVKEKTEDYIDKAKGTARIYVTRSKDFIENIFTKTADPGKEAHKKENNGEGYSSR